jgi:hypothetical protein
MGSLSKATSRKYQACMYESRSSAAGREGTLAEPAFAVLGVDQCKPWIVITKLLQQMPVIG